MADNIDPNSNKNISQNFLPRFYRTDANKKFLQATIEQLIQPGTVKKVNGYIGRQHAKAVNKNDIFIDAPEKLRQDYQLEPSLVIDDSIGNTSFFKDYQDYINQLNVFGSITTNHERLNKEEFYSWDPHIDWDKFVNFQNYYWLPTGPDVVIIYGQSAEIISEYTVNVKSEGNNNVYIFTPNGLTENPILTLYRGQTYKFNITSPGNPFSIKTARDLLSYSLTGDPVETGTITFEVPLTCPDVIYYQSSNDIDLGGVIHVLNITDNSNIDVKSEILGKKEYKLSSGTYLSNGMKVSFGGKVSPSSYANKKFYVEGVGTEIRLINEDILEMVSAYSNLETILFDTMPFDKLPFNETSSYAGTPDYIVINRASQDRNPWSRYNRWFHKDVIETSATENNTTPTLDQSARAVRPIIEFEANLKLFNFGATAIEDVDLIDTVTTDAFSVIEGAFGYNIDGINLLNGHRVIFTADTDVLVKNKVFRVEMVDVIRATQTNVLSTIATSTTNIGNKITVETTENMQVGQRIRFYGTGIGNIVPNKTYYILGIYDQTTISISDKVKGNIIPQIVASGSMTVSSVYESTSRQIHLVEEVDPLANSAVLVHQGRSNQGVMYWYTGSEWKISQQKTSLNQPPYFDVVDSNTDRFADTSVYQGSTFNGTKVFSYKIGTGSIDNTLGFPLSYKSINNVGDIVFNFNLETDQFQYEVASRTQTHKVNTGFLIKTSYAGETQYVNGWQKNNSVHTQAAIRNYKDSDKFNNFKIDIFDDLEDLKDLKVIVYVNGSRLSTDEWYIATYSTETQDAIPYKKEIILNTDLTAEDVLTIKAYAAQPINSNGYYEIPKNLQNNPLNGVITDFTLGEVIDHVSSIIESIEGFSGSYPGPSNLRDLGNTTQFGTRFIQHSGPASLSLYHITSEDNNVIRALEKSRDDYNIFKKNFVSVAERLGVDTDVITQVNLILEEINKDKPSSFPYYFSDMVPYGPSLKTTITVVDYRTTMYPLANIFDLTSLSNKAVGVYLNNEQLLHRRDYTFSDQGFIIISATLRNDDTITIYEYESTDGCFVPETPTKLGIWPKFEPKIYVDTSYLTPRTVIQGHDGSIILAYNDYRDELILELEKRIYNNIKVAYDAEIYDIFDIIPSYNRDNEYSLSEFNQVLAPAFYKWTSLIDRDFTRPISYDSNNSFSFNYRGHVAPDGRETPGYWRGIYRWILDTDRPNICPWEMLGMSEEPLWWRDVYGPAPYTSDNLVLWSDISNGFVKEPNKSIVKVEKFAKPFLLEHIPVNEAGDLISPASTGLSNGIFTGLSESNFVFGDVSPVESAWRRSSYYPFSVLIASILLTPSKTFGVLLDRSRVVRNLTGQLVYKDTGLRITPSDIKLPSIYSSTSRIQTAGIINYLVNYISNDNLKSYSQYSYDLSNMEARLSYRVSAFTSKEKFHLLLDSKNPASAGSVFVPKENYKIIVNKSSPIKKISYSGIIITKLQSGFEVKGYNRSRPYFTCYTHGQFSPSITVNVGGISESFSVWEERQKYYVKKIVFFDRKYYRVLETHTTKTEFEPLYYEVLPSLPVVGGSSALFKKQWDKISPVTIPYGTVFEDVQSVVDFIRGYGAWLSDQGFIFETFNESLASITNWDTSAKEFMFWTTQHWSSGQDKWDEWDSSSLILFGSIVRYNGEYYRAIKTIAAGEVFNSNDYVKLDGLSTVGSSVVSLSPSALKLDFKINLSVVDDINNPFNGYEIVRVDGNPIPPNFINSFREDTAVSYAPQSEDGIYGASFYLVQNEHVVIFDNTTMFNDTIYNPESGYKQDRIKVSGYVSSSWNGSFNVPGFIFDNAVIKEWEPWTSYALGDIVKHKQFYYSAITSIRGTTNFDSTDWTKLDSKPASRLLPNWTYKATQFTDFYSLDSDNFDIGQQKMAQHLIGYQKRQYLENIIQDDVSEFKFYQGMISEKGTQNVLNKLFDVLSADDQDSLKFYEEWAIRVGQYGASSAYDTIEFVLDESLFKNNPQGFELTSTPDNLAADFIIRQSPSDIYLKPIGYNSSPWPVLKTEQRILRSPGYVRTDEVRLSLQTIDDIVNYDIDLFNEGDYVWCSFESYRWNVYRYTNIGITVEDITLNDGQLTVITNSLVTVKVDSYVGIHQTTNLNGFYKVLSTSLNTMVLDAPAASLSEIFTEQSAIVVYNFKSHRAVSIDSADRVFPANLKVGEKVWTDDDGTGKNASWTYSPVYVGTEIVNSDPQTDLYFGRDISVNSSGNLLAISTATGEIIIYDKAKPSADWVRRQVIEKPYICDNIIISTTEGGDTIVQNGSEERNVNPDIVFASVVAMSPDNNWLATGSPDASNASSKFSGTYNPVKTYTQGSIVVVDLVYYKAKLNVPTYTTPTQSTSHWQEISYIPVDTDGLPSSLNRQGVISLYQKDSNNIYTLVDTIISPAPIENENFGSSITFGNNEIFVTAGGYNDNAGKVYRLSYSSKIRATASYNPAGSAGTTIVVSETDKIQIGMAVNGIGFISGQYVISKNDTKLTLELSAPPDSTPQGTLEFTVTEWGYDNTFAVIGEEVESRCGSMIVISKDFTTLVISCPGINGYALVYIRSGIGFSLKQTITASELYPYFSKGIAVSDDGAYICISDIRADEEQLSQGSVYIYQYDSIADIYYQTQKIQNIKTESSQEFGSKVFFVNDSKTLIVYSANADSFINMTFDNSSTVFDNGSTNFVTRYIDSGRVDIYDRYSTSWIYSESLITSNTDKDGYGTGLAVSNNSIIVGAPYETDTVAHSGKVYQYNKPQGEFSWTINHSTIDKPDVSKIKQAFLYNKKSNQLITYLDVIDPSQGKYPGIADQEIWFKTFYDPAVYSVGNSTVTVDDGSAWTTNQVGKLWWDLRTAKFINSYDDDIVYRNSVWNTLATGASIDIYEWVETSLLPSDWDDRADTEAGLVLGISGTTLYGDSVYSVDRRYDNISRTFTNTYYYWVKNKKTVPYVNGRNISAQLVSNLISNPRGEGYSYLALTGVNSFSLVNVKNLLSSTDVVLSVEYWTVENINQNIHTEWKLINNQSSADLPNSIEQKWIDSLCGKDIAGREVPDVNNPIKLRYGIENRPIQSMFVNRIEALKQVIEKANSILKSNLIVGSRDISNLSSIDEPPSAIKGLYDAVRDTDAELRFESLHLFRKPSLSPIIVNGKITGIIINDAGKGYSVAPYIEIVGKGTGARIRTLIDTTGKITGCDIISSGQGYDFDTTITIRSYSILVLSDSTANGVWSIYSFDVVSQIWSRVVSQTYNTTKYWEYVDWYSDGFSQFSIINHAIENYSDLTNLNSSIGEIVKVRTTSLGSWMLLQKYADSTSYDWTQSYKVVGCQNGTIQLSSLLYDFSDTSVGFDGLLYDGGIFDNSASTELRIILTVLKDNIFIDDLKSEYLNLFFVSVRYALSEQTYLDWIFKTSFVKVQHNVGKLRQRINYKNDSLQDFEEYVSEVKPYRTQVREYTSAYTNIDSALSAITDFDLIPISSGRVIDAFVKNEAFEISNAEVQTYPWKFWLDNAGYSVIALKIVDNGSGYVNKPIIRIVSPSGTGATANVFISNGKLNRVVLVTSGAGYLAAPTVYIEGGLADGGTPAKVIAIIGDGVVRSTMIKMKFDRLTQTKVVAQLQETETFTSNGFRLQYPLIWGPDARVGYSSVTINGVDVLRDTYTLRTVSSMLDGATVYSGSITFETAPKAGSIIIVNYHKDWALLTAADRIEYYYNPESGELGNDLSQLMTGIDYGGVVVTGLGFELSGGWGSSPYAAESWDSYDANFDDYIISVPADTHTFTLPYQPLEFTELNIYYIGQRSTTYIADGIETVYSYDFAYQNPKVRIVKILNTIAPSSTKNVAGSKILSVSSTSSIQIGDIVTDNTEFGVATRTLVTATDSGSNIITVRSTAGMSEGMPAFFYGKGIGGLIEGMYYIRSIESETTITLSITDNGPAYTITETSEGLQTLIFGMFNYNTYVAKIINGTDIELNQPLYSNLATGTEIKFNRSVEKLNGIYSIINGVLTLVEAPAIGSIIEISGTLDPIRLDDLNYGTPNQTNVDAIMETIISDGISPTVTIPSTFNVLAGDTFIIRKSTSDGSVAPTDLEYDTALSGGNFEYTTAMGIAADDIIVDGDDFVTSTSSPAPEEVVPGQVVDSVAIKVFDKPLTLTSNIRVDNFISNGIDTEYTITNTINSQQSVIVKVGETVLSMYTDYTVDIENNSINLGSAPPLNSVVTIFSVGFNGYDILDIKTFISDGSTNEIQTEAAWIETASIVVYINGLPTEVEIFNSDNFVAFRTVEPIELDLIVTYIVTLTSYETVSITKTEQILANGTDTYELLYNVGDSLPAESSMIVRIGQTILKGPNNNYFTIENNRLNYVVNQAKAAPYSVDISNILVYADGVQLTLGTDYTVDLSGITVKINKKVYKTYTGKTLNIGIKQGYSYSVISSTPTLTLPQAYNSPTVIEVTSSFNHNMLDIRRSTVKVISDNIQYFNYAGEYSTSLTLDRSVVNDNFIWVTKNGNLLTPSVDYKLNDDKISITLSNDRTTDDEFELITFSNNLVNPTISYMQFKDMLNRVHFKRLSLDKQTQLAKNLHYTDQTITVKDASMFDYPRPDINKPGIIEIRGERIEFFEITGNVLSRLRRGTLGTSCPPIHKVGAYVQEISGSETIPYTDSTVVSQSVSDGTHYVDINFIPTKSDSNWSYLSNFESSIPQFFGQCNDVEVFVGGYNTNVVWKSGTVYQINDIVTIGSYTYRCITDHTSTSLFKNDLANWTFFIGNIRLKKEPYKVHNANNSLYSPAGDVQFDADFTVDGFSKQIRLTNVLDAGTHVTVIKRTGQAWDSIANIREDDSKIAAFLKAKPGIWYSNIGKYPDIQSTFDSTTGTFDSNSITFDQG